MAKKAFGNYTAEQIFASEAVTYVVIAGMSVFERNGNCFFTKGIANRNCKKLYAELIKQYFHGNKKERKSAERLLWSLRVEPLRIH